MLKMLRWVLPSTLLVTAVALVGCTPNSTSSSPTTNQPELEKPKTEADEEEHEHELGLHNGLIVEVGRHNYHIEVVLEAGGVIKIYTLAKNEEVVYEVEAQKLSAFAKLPEAMESLPFDLEPQPQDGDAQGKTSLFVGQLPAAVVGQETNITIPALRFGTERFRVSFSTQAMKKDHDAHPTQPKVVDKEEAKLYLTPGGKYTEADIKANGNMVASLKFKGIKANHDAKPMAGDKLCPISQTKANAEFTWVVDGQKYQFCCPPCVDEFVQMAKEKPVEILPAAEYVQK